MSTDRNIPVGVFRGKGGTDDEGDGTEDEPTFPMTLPKAEFDAMVAIEVMDEEEDVPVAKKVADMISAYVKEPEEGEEVDELFNSHRCFGRRLPLVQKAAHVGVRATVGIDRKG